MALVLSIPETILEALRLPEDQQESELLKELALSLYERGYLSFGKARELALLDKRAFSCLLGDRGIARHYGATELQEDIEYGRRQ